jgi:hypothetical protein
MKATFLSDVESVIAAHGDYLRKLLGTRLTESWIVWDRDEESWFADEPVVLGFEGRNLEIVFWQLDELSLTWNAIDLQQPPNWFGCYDGLNLEWRRNAHPVLGTALGRTVDTISLVEMLNETGIMPGREWLLHALQFHFGNSTMTIYNSLDENGLSNDILIHPRYRTTAMIKR